MPRWGRPPGARLGRQARWRAAQWMDDDARIQEVDSDDGEAAYEMQDGLSFYPRRHGVDADGGYGLRRRALEYDRYADDGESVDGTDYDLYDDEDSTVAYAVQLAMKDKEEWLVEKALERIRRAQMLGQGNVRLSKREVEALERKRMQGEPRRKKQAGSQRTPGGRATGARPPSSSGQRPRTPTTYSPRAQQSMAPLRPPYPQPYSPDRYPSAVENRPSSSRTEAFQRPLPDDPRWVPPYRSMPHYAPYSVEQSPYLPYLPFDGRHPPPGTPPAGYRSFSDGRHGSSTSNSLSPHIAASESGTEDSSEEESDESEKAEQKVSPSARKPAAASRAGRQRAKRR
ncbi:hypothetical protein PHISP_08130 [Aspergillus sp. HF37]|nr:hypothetical protein PHISP_08130 [Aspergillus sp. HF37]